MCIRDRFEDLETEVKKRFFFLRPGQLHLAIGVVGGLLFLNFFDHPADTLFADVGDSLIPCFVGFGLFIAGLGQLDHDKLTVTAVFFVLLKHSMGGCG